MILWFERAPEAHNILPKIAVWPSCLAILSPEGPRDKTCLYECWDGLLFRTVAHTENSFLTGAMSLVFFEVLAVQNKPTIIMFACQFLFSCSVDMCMCILCGWHIYRTSDLRKSS